MKNFKKVLLLVALMVVFVFAFSACGDNDDDDNGDINGNGSNVEDTQPPQGAPPITTPDTTADTFLWNNFVGRDPHNMPGVSPNGAPMWWDNWANLRANVENDIVQIQFRPGAFDPEDFDDYDDFYARASDWMGNWGEAIDMWSLDGISYMRYLTIRMAGEVGGEEMSLLLHFQPDDGPSFVARFADLVLADGSNPLITTDMQDIVINLEASGFPGMTNRMHIRAFAPATIFLDEIYFSGAIAPIDTTSSETIQAGFTVTPTGPPADLNIRGFRNEARGLFVWNEFGGRDPHNRPATSANGAPIWWDNWANLRANTGDTSVQIEFRPSAFDPEDFDDYDDYFARANDWMGNWGEAIDMWSLDRISFTRYMTIRMAGAAGGEENRLLLHFVPEDGPSFVARFSDLVVQGGGNAAITTDMQDIVIDLQASGFPGMTNRMHIRAFAECTIYLGSIYFHGSVAPVDTTDRDTILGGMTVAEIGNPASLPIRDFIAELN